MAPGPWVWFDVLQYLQREEHDVEDISQKCDKMQLQKDEKGRPSVTIQQQIWLNLFGFGFGHLGPGGRKGSASSRTAGALSKTKQHRTLNSYYLRLPADLLARRP